jgi:hypothetical protein
LGCIKMLMKNQDFHAAKKGKQLTVGLWAQYFFPSQALLFL